MQGRRRGHGGGTRLTRPGARRARDVAEHVLRFRATLDACGHASSQLATLLDAHAIAGKPRYDVELVFEEIVGNVIRHGTSADAECAIEVRVAFDERAVVMRFEDDGRPFDPRTHQVARRPATLDDAQEGGLGLLLVRRVSSHLDYERTARNRNLTTVTIALPEPA